MTLQERLHEAIDACLAQPHGSNVSELVRQRLTDSVGAVEEYVVTSLCDTHGDDACEFTRSQLVSADIGAAADQLQMLVRAHQMVYDLERELAQRIDFEFQHNGVYERFTAGVKARRERKRQLQAARREYEDKRRRVLTANNVHRTNDNNNDESDGDTCSSASSSTSSSDGEEEYTENDV